jgi:hypothetical protein
MRTSEFFAQILKKSQTGLPQVSASQNTLAKILTIVFTIIGAMALLFMIIAGLRYITSAGDPAKVATAKNQILYTAIGLIIAASAAAVVNFVLFRAS